MFFLFSFNLGGQLSLAEVIALVNKRERSLLKSQCGGIQTLLKNNYHVFQGRANILLRLYA